MDEKVKYKIEYRYDALNRLTSVCCGEGSPTRYAYDFAGNLVAIGATAENIESTGKKTLQQPPGGNPPGPGPFEWYLHRGGQQFGPYSEEQLRQFTSEELLQVDDLLWHDGLEGWITFDEAEKIIYR